MKEKVTLFYMKSSGKIKGFCTGVQTMDYFGEDKEDYSLIMNFIVVNKEDFNLDLREFYRVNDEKLILNIEGELNG